MKKIYLALILFLLVMVVGCGKETEQKKNPYFQATVLEVKENSILVEPFEGEQELTSVDRYPQMSSRFKKCLRWRKEQRYELSIMGKLQNLIRHKSIMFLRYTL